LSQLERLQQFLGTSDDKLSVGIYRIDKTTILIAAIANSIDGIPSTNRIDKTRILIAAIGNSPRAPKIRNDWRQEQHRGTITVYYRINLPPNYECCCIDQKYNTSKRRR